MTKSTEHKPRKQRKTRQDKIEKREKRKEERKEKNAQKTLTSKPESKTEQFFIIFIICGRKSLEKKHHAHVGCRSLCNPKETNRKEKRKEKKNA